MGSRAEDLTLAAKPIAQDLARSYGSLKNVLSAGVIAFSQLTSIEREKVMKAATVLPGDAQHVILDHLRREIDESNLPAKEKKIRLKLLEKIEERSSTKTADLQDNQG